MVPSFVGAGGDRESGGTLVWGVVFYRRRRRRSSSSSSSCSSSNHYPDPNALSLPSSSSFLLRPLENRDFSTGDCPTTSGTAPPCKLRCVVVVVVVVGGGGGRRRKEEEENRTPSFFY